jgi:fatty acid desaturase
MDNAAEAREGVRPAPAGEERRIGGLARVIVILVVAVWVCGAVAQIVLPRYVQPWWIHAIALFTISYALTGQFVHSKFAALLRTYGR